ncbi:hypothetical protein MBLNU13_g09129t2 [Cladosporium sp. NU13]
MSQPTQNAPADLFVNDGKNGSFKPYEAFNYTDWLPDASLYSELPMVEKYMEVDGQQLTYQDFNVSALSVEQFKEHFMNLPQFFDGKGNLVPTVDAVKSYQYGS